MMFIKNIGFERLYFLPADYVLAIYILNFWYRLMPKSIK